MIRKAMHILQLVGKLKNSHTISEVPGLLVIRKGVKKAKLRDYCSQYKCHPKKTKFVAFVSSPYIYVNDYVRSAVELWLHPFREPEKYLPASAKWHFMSESDFVDIKTFKSYGSRQEQWDYFYYTIGGGDGIEHKGYELFRQVLPALAHLKGVVIIYGKQAKFPHKELKYLRSKGLKVITKLLGVESIQNIYLSSRFGLFPNITDCSPRMIPECMIHNTPVVVNENILGGWKYVAPETGMFFNKDLTRADVDKFLSRKRTPKKYFMNRYGFRRSATKLAKILSKHYPQVADFDMVYFSTHRSIMERVVG